MMRPDIEKTRAYYRALGPENICDCAYCRNYCAKVRAAYPEVARYYQFDPYREIQLEADQVPVIKTFSQSIVNWLEEHGTDENRVVQQYGLSFPEIRRFADELGHAAMEHGYGLSGLGD